MGDQHQIDKKTDINREGADKTVRERDEKVEELSVLYTEAKR